MSDQESNVEALALVASCHAVSISPFLLVRSFDLVWMRMCSTPTNSPLDRYFMALADIFVFVSEGFEGLGGSRSTGLDIKEVGDWRGGVGLLQREGR